MLWLHPNRSITELISKLQSLQVLDYLGTRDVFFQMVEKIACEILYFLVLPNSISYIIGSNCQNRLEISFGSDRVVLALLKGYTLIWCRLRLGGDQQALFFAPPNMFNRLGIFFTSVTKYGKNIWFPKQKFTKFIDLWLMSLCK